MKTHEKTARWLSWLVAAGAAVVSAVGVFMPEVYRDRSVWFRSVWVGNDWVTLVVAVPVLVVSLWLAGRGSLRARLLWLGSVGYMLYNYAYYLLGARLNALFPAYVILWVTSLFILILALGQLDVQSIAARFGGRGVREKLVSVYMLFTGIGLTFAWIGQWAGIVFGDLRPNLGEAGFQLVAAMDLSFMVPYFLVGGVLLWRRRPWGYVVSPIILTQGALYTLVLAVNSGRMAVAGQMGGSELPVWATWTAVGVTALVALLAGVRGEATDASAGAASGSGTSAG